MFMKIHHCRYTVGMKANVKDASGWKAMGWFMVVTDIKHDLALNEA